LQWGGSVVNVASTRALIKEKNSEAYAMSKGGLQALTHAISFSYSDENITTNCISHGWIHTGDADQLHDIHQQQQPTKRVRIPEDVSRGCLSITDYANDFITGENLVIDCGMTRKMI